jgi:AraC-like DNA-binding protein
VSEAERRLLWGARSRTSFLLVWTGREGGAWWFLGVLAVLYRDVVVDLVIEQRYAAGDAEEASAALQGVFGVGTVTVQSDGALRYEQQSLVDDGISATRLTSSGAVLRVDADAAPDMVAIVVRSGYMVLKQSGETIALQAGDLGIIPLQQAARLSWEQVVMDLYSFPRSSVAHLLGSDAEQLSLRVARLKAASAGIVALWVHAASALHEQVLRNPELFESDVIRERSIDALLGLTIEAFGISDAHEDDPNDDEHRLQRAVTFMNGNLARSISVMDIAHEVGVSARGLQLVFQRTGHGSPLAHLRALRMNAAREALLTGTGEPPSMIAVAGHSGYSNLGRFRAHYRDAFSESPEETVRAARASLTSPLNANGVRS